MPETGQFTQVSAVRTPEGMTVLYAVDDMGNIWKLLDQPGVEVECVEEPAVRPR